MNNYKITEPFKNLLNLTPEDVKILNLYYTSEKRYITTTEFLQFHSLASGLMLQSTISVQTQEILSSQWINVLKSLYEYRLGVYLRVLKSPFKKQISFFLHLYIIWCCLVHKKKDMSILRSLLLSCSSSLSSLKRKIFFTRLWFRYGGNLSIAKGVQLGKYSQLLLTRFDSKITLKQNVRISSYCHLKADNEGHITLHNNVFLNNYCSITSLSTIEIEENTIIGEGVKIYDHNHAYHINDNQLTIEHNAYTCKPVKIGRNCWIGSNVTILCGVEIGENAIIGANNLIYKAVPSNSIVKAKNEPVIQSV